MVTLHLSSSLLASHGFRHGFSLRRGGVSAAAFDSLNLARNVGDDAAHVAENRRRFAASVGFAEAQLFEVSQVHGQRVLNVSDVPEPLSVRTQEADALVAMGRAKVVGVRVADCIALLLACPVTGAVAAVHAGWRGVASTIASCAIDCMAEQLGARREALLAAFFPHIGPGSFEVGEEVAQQVAASAREAADVIVRVVGHEKPRVNLAAALVAQLTRAGLRRDHIEQVPGCTFADRARFFSFRRDGQASGRHLAVIEARC